MEKTIKDRVEVFCAPSYDRYMIGLNWTSVASGKPWGRCVCDLKTTYADIAYAFSVDELQMMLDYRRGK